MEKLKIGLVGAGSRGPQHLTTIVAIHDRYELVGICDVDEEKRNAASARFNAPAFANIDDMLDKAKPDVVSLIVGNRALPDLVPIVAQAGVHIATETPIARTLPVADFVIGAAQKAGVKLENFEQCWRWPREQVKRKLIASGIMGRMLLARCYTYVAPYHGNAVFQNAVGSKVKQVVGFGRELPPSPSAGRDGGPAQPRKWFVAGLEHENGVPGVFEMKIQATTISGHDFTNVSIDFEQGHILHDKIYITRDAATPKEGGVHEATGSLVHYPLQEQWEENQGIRMLSKVWIDTDPEIAWEHPYMQYAPELIHAGTDHYGRLEEYIHWHRVVVNDEEPEYGMERARHNIEVMIAAQHSALNNSQMLTLPLDPTIETPFQN